MFAAIFVLLVSISICALVLAFVLWLFRSASRLAQYAPMSFVLAACAMCFLTYVLATANANKPEYINGVLKLKPNQCVNDKHTPKYGPRCADEHGIEYVRGSDFLPAWQQ